MKVVRPVKKVVLVLILAITVSLASPIKRQFIHLPGSYAIYRSPTTAVTFRVLQFNVLADGLSGLRTDKGGFSRVEKEILLWENRKDSLLKEITQYEPDIITLQEVDHYYDFFYRELDKKGYSGYFAPKPTSACLEVSANGDGCALFIRRSKFKVLSCETKTLALSIAGLNEGELLEDDSNIKAQNQVGLLTVCEFRELQATQSPRSFFGGNLVDASQLEQKRPPPLIICTTHLKSSKSFIGERYRQKAANQILDMTDSLFRSLARAGRVPVVLLAGDFNAVPNRASYSEPLAYMTVKNHSLGLRSVYNEDITLAAKPLSCGPDLYTTWKARISKGQENTIKRCIDYIFYGPYVPKTSNTKKKIGMPLPLSISHERKPAVKATTVSQVAVSVLLRFSVYLIFSIIPLSSLFVYDITVDEKLFLVAVSMISLVLFELVSYGTIFKPEISDVISNKIEADTSVSPVVASPLGKVKNALGQRLSSFTKSQVVQDGRPGLQPLAVLDIFSEESMGQSYIPAEWYPSDHVAIAADFRLLWDNESPE